MGSTQWCTYEHHDMDMLSTFLALWEGNPPSLVDSGNKRPGMQTFHFYVILNMVLNEPWWRIDMGMFFTNWCHWNAMVWNTTALKWCHSYYTRKIIPDRDAGRTNNYSGFKIGRNILAKQLWWDYQWMPLTTCKEHIRLSAKVCPCLSHWTYDSFALNTQTYSILWPYKRDINSLVVSFCHNIAT